MEHHHDGHGKHEGHNPVDFLRKFWFSLILTIPILAYSELAERFFGWRAPAVYGSEYVSLVLGSVIFFYSGWIFLRGAYRELKAWLPGMMTLIALAIIAAYSYSVFSVFRGIQHTLFWELATLIDVMLLGHYIEMRAVQGAKGALNELTKLLPDTAEVIQGNTTHKVQLSELKIGYTVLVKPGSKVPVDGVVGEGESELDESIITGESKPVHKKEGDEVIAGSINGDGSLRVTVTKIGEKTFLAGIMRLVAEAQASKSRLQMLSDRAALYLTFLSVGAGIVTFVAWIFIERDVLYAVERLVAVLVIACPHALGIAIPLVASISTTMAAQKGFLVRQRLSLESARSISMVLFDKTGTLTKGEFGIDAIVPGPGVAEDDVLQKAASINNHSEHSLAKAMVQEAHKRNMPLLEVKKFERIAGKGAKGNVANREIFLGNESLLRENNISVSKELQEKIQKLSQQGKTVIYVLGERSLMGVIALADIIRPESQAAIQELKAMNIRTAMITGDSEDVAHWVAEELGIDEYFAGVMPHQKSEKVSLLQSRGEKVAMVGDGVNDAPALTQADVGVAIGAGTNVAIESAGIVLIKNDPRAIAKIITLSRLTYRKMIQNLFWATAYNIVALPVAAGVLAFQGIILQPAVAAICMSLSTVIVSINAILLKNRKL
jgi:P-type Cu2+ transporter